MKPFVKLLCVVVFSLFFIFQISFAEEKTQTEDTLGVSQLMTAARDQMDTTDTDALPEIITVQGVVSKVFPQDNLIALIDDPNTNSCDVKTCKKTCSKSTSKDCSKACTKSCPKLSGQDTGKKCPRTASEDTGKTGKKTSAQKCDKACTKPCPVSASECTKKCPKKAAKACSNTDYILTLPVKWNGDMPELSTAVNVVGKITHKDGRMLFVADSIQMKPDTE